MPSPVYVGLDCGGTTTRVVATHADGEVLFRGQSGAANLASTSEEVIRASLKKATDGCPQPVAACGCFAGLLTPADCDRALALLAELFPTAALRAEPDAAAAFYAAEPRADICVIAGTGSLVCSEGSTGLIRSGGRGYLLGDEGSAFQLGRETIRRYLDAPETISERLKDEVQRVFETPEPSAVVAAVYKAASPSATLARFAAILGEDAKSAEPYAAEIIKKSASALAIVAAEHAKRYLPMATNLRISLAGGVWKILGMSEAFTYELTELLSGSVIKVEVSHRPPVLGAVALAMEIKLGN